jgi:hypothetical protein
MRSSRASDKGHGGLKLQILAQLTAAKEMLHRVLTAAPTAPANFFRPVFVARLTK